ncbi:MAG: CIA30 family protein [Phycisphaeraceae bacterium]
MKQHCAIALSIVGTLLVLSASDVREDAKPQPAEGVLLEDFADEEEASERWVTVNDGVMGGKSEGGPAFADGRMTFAGEIDTDGGGFSSVRTRPAEHDLSGMAGLLLRVRGDGRTYQASLRTDATRGRWWVPFRAAFATQKGEWTEVYVPFERMTPSIMGRPITQDPPALELDQVKSVGLMLADGKDGPFTLEVDWVRAVPAAPASSEDVE